MNGLNAIVVSHPINIRLIADYFYSRSSTFLFLVYVYFKHTFRQKSTKFNSNYMLVVSPYEVLSMCLITRMLRMKSIIRENIFTKKSHLNPYLALLNNIFFLILFYPNMRNTINLDTTNELWENIYKAWPYLNVKYSIPHFICKKI